MGVKTHVGLGTLSFSKMNVLLRPSLGTGSPLFSASVGQRPLSDLIQDIF